MEEKQPTLIDLEDTTLTVADPIDDLRGRKVLDRDGEEVGEVDGLVIDERDRAVRFLRIASGGFLGFGKTKRLVPIDAIVDIRDEDVAIDRTRENVAGSSPYDPDLVEGPDFYTGLYGYYGYLPFWSPGYVRPTPPGRPPADR